MTRADPQAIRRLAVRIAVVFVLATAVISQCLEWMRAGLDLNSEVVAPAQYGPALAALFTWLVFRRRIGTVMPAPVSGGEVRARVGLGVAVCALFALLVWVGFFLIGGRESYGIQDVGGVSFWLVAVVWLVGAAAEEVGWRGVLQPVLETRLPRWGAGIITGLLWAVWHVPVITMGAAIAVVFITSTTVLAVLMAYLGNGSPVQRVITTSLVHWLVNLAILIVVGVKFDLAGLTSWLVAISITTVVALAVLVWWRPLRCRHGHPAPRDADAHQA